jgi:hypothetical protein
MVALKGPLAARAVGVDPPMIAGGVGEQVHLLLGDLHPVGGAQTLAHPFQQIRRCV